MLALVTFLIVFLAFWKRDIALYLVAGPVSISYGYVLYIDYRTPMAFVLSLALGCIGAIMLYLAIKGIYTNAKQGRE